jgi:large subunit ribosomal protein L5
MKKHLQLLERLNTKHKTTVARFQHIKKLIFCTPCPIDKTQPSLVLPLFGKPISNPSLISRRRGYSQTERFYRQIVARDLILQNQIRGGMEVSLAPKVVLNTTSRRFAANRKELTIGLATVMVISGQRGQPTSARKSVAAFKLREGTPLGCKVTLRGKMAYSMLDKLMTFVLPRGHSSHVRGTIDQAGNWGIGVSDPLLFIELESQYDMFRSLEGINISIVTNKSCRRFVLLFASGLQLFVQPAYLSISNQSSIGNN